MFRSLRRTLSTVHQPINKAKFNRDMLITFTIAGSIVAGSAYLLYTPKKSTMNLSPLKNNPLVIFVLGNAGAGKGTQCQKIAKDYDFEHLSGI